MLSAVKYPQGIDIMIRGGITFRKRVNSSGGVRKHADSSGGAMFSCLLETCR